jgi:hypothetical protein
VGHPGLIYKTHRAVQERSSYIQIGLQSSFHDPDSPTIEQGT